MDDPRPEPPFFYGVEPRMWTPNRRYRVYVLPRELVFLRAGSAGEFKAALGTHFGLIGGLLSGLARARDVDKKTAEPAIVHPEQFVDEHKYNFRAAAADIEDVRIEPRSLWLAATYHQQNHTGVFRFRHQSRGSVRLAVETVDGLKTALEQLPKTIGDRLTINVEWDERKNRFIRKKVRAGRA